MVLCACVETSIELYVYEYNSIYILQDIDYSMSYILQKQVESKLFFPRTIMFSMGSSTCTVWEKNPWDLEKGMYFCVLILREWRRHMVEKLKRKLSNSGNCFQMPWIWLWVKWITKTSMYSYSSSSPNPVSRLRNEGADNCKKHLSCTWRIDSILAEKLAEKHVCFKTRQNNTKLQSIIAGGFGNEGGRCN